jgi:hypothetical protein
MESPILTRVRKSLRPYATLKLNIKIKTEAGRRKPYLCTHLFLREKTIPEETYF